MKPETEDLILKAQIIGTLIDTHLFASAIVKSKTKRFLEELISNGHKLKEDPEFKKIHLSGTPDFTKLQQIDQLF